MTAEMTDLDWVVALQAIKTLKAKRIRALDTKDWATYEALHGGFAPVAAEFGMEWELHDTAVQPRVLIMVSKAGHCLNDLLYRRAAESLRIDVPLVVGNHPDLAPLAAAHGVPFEHVPAGGDPLARQRSDERSRRDRGRSSHALRAGREGTGRPAAHARHAASPEGLDHSCTR